MRRILCVDGGGIKGVFPASFLASLERDLGEPIRDYFDLVVGTSTGGIVALGMGLGLSSSELLEFYQAHGPTVFRRRPWRFGFFTAKYDSEPLRAALQSVFGHKLLGNSQKRLVIPSFNAELGEVHLWKTAHHPRFERDFAHTAVEVAMATAAAPVYFRTFLSGGCLPLVDGGMWANNPVMVAVAEAIGILRWPREDLRILSLGCTMEPLRVRWRRPGLATWGPKVVGVFLQGQTASALGMAGHLIGSREHLLRISPLVPDGRFALDSAKEIPSLKGLGDCEARKALPKIRDLFMNGRKAEEFIPCHTLSA